ncbi:MAG: LpxI family protein [Syntrophothermus sp.]
MEKVGIIAGYGLLPVVCAKEIRRAGKSPLVVGVTNDLSPELAKVADEMHYINPGQLQRIIDTFLDRGVRELLMLGKIKKDIVFSGIDFDARVKAILSRIRDKRDDSLLLAFVEEMARDGLVVREQTAYLQELLPEKGVLGERRPSDVEWEDIHFGFPIAKSIAGLDIGQTLVVKGKAVLAVEAIEGTDQAIRRGGALGRGGVVVIKVSKPQQDLRFDMPTVGTDTVESMRAAGAAALAMEAGKTLLLQREEVIAQADAAGLALVAV